MNSSTAVVVRRDHREYEMLMVVAGFLAGYTGNTRLAYQHDLRVFVSWCRNQHLHLMDVVRAHIELFARSQETVGLARATIARRLSTVASFYRYCVEEELLVRSPAVNVRRPKLRAESPMTGLDRNELVTPPTSSPPSSQEPPDEHLKGNISAVMCGLVGSCAVDRNVEGARTGLSFLTGLFAQVHPLYWTVHTLGPARRYQGGFCDP
jgi:hypothetical protein